ncbi:MAG TPA: hypothetical protein DGG94_03030 [Micromonosporaceae bacterium]|nr:hypothetical protein [Micromonosporaceae bacterium]HCU48790.1 hypothetical protein [Micromonosporaceae bacterium]
MNGAGAVATQADLSAGFGRKALALLRNSEKSVELIIAELLRQHKNTRGWQVAVLGVGACVGLTRVIFVCPARVIAWALAITTRSIL